VVTEAHPQDHELLYRSNSQVNHAATKTKLGAMLALLGYEIDFHKAGSAQQK
jgi:hypothetical protein